MSTAPGAGIELRPLGMGELLDYTIRIYKRIFPLVVLPYTILQGPFLIGLYFFTTLLNLLTSDLSTNPDNPLSGSAPNWSVIFDWILNTTGLDLSWMGQNDAWDWLAMAGWFGVVGLLVWVSESLLRVGIVAAAGSRILGLVPTWSVVLGAYQRFGLRAILLPFVKGLLLSAILLLPCLFFFGGLILGGDTPGVGEILLMVLGGLLFMVAYFVVIWLANALNFAECALVVEDLQVGAAIRRSLALVRGHWWRTFFAVFLLQLIVQLVVGMMTGLTTLLLKALLSARAELWISTVMQTALHIFFIPLAWVLLVLLYIDLRVRKEHFDLYYLMGALGSDVELGAPAPAPVPVGESVGRTRAPSPALRPPSDHPPQPPNHPPQPPS